MRIIPSRKITFLILVTILFPYKNSAQFIPFGFLKQPKVNVQSCPTGYARVPADMVYASTDFCVMIYEAKNVSGSPASQPSPAAWINISQVNSLAACQALGSGYDLISNAQWQAIARNVENVAANWSTNIVGSGCLLAGNVLILDACSYHYSGVIPDSGTSRDPKAKLVLSNGVELWDFSGNVWEWVKETSAQLGVNPGLSQALHQFPSLSTQNKSLFAPQNATFDSSKKVGQVYGGSGSAVLRGSSYKNSSLKGVFSAYLPYSTSSIYEFAGFRCVYTL